jgi:hypothetical protein
VLRLISEQGFVRSIHPPSETAYMGSTPLKEYMLDNSSYTFNLVMVPYLGTLSAPFQETADKP